MQLLRLIKIIWVLLRYRLDTLVHASDNFWLNQLFRLLQCLPQPHSSNGERLRLALESLGPVFVKFGQMISTRRDLISPDMAAELAQLQDNVLPFDSAEAVAVIESQLGQPLHQIYSDFNHQPLASASIAQVHQATLHSGEQVVVKVLRPGIDSIIASDLKLLYTLAKLVAQYHPDGKRLRPVEIVQQYEYTLQDELNLQIEAANTSQLRRNFDHSELLYVPEIYWDYCSRKMITMEEIHGIPVGDIAELKAAGINMKQLGERGVEIFFTQLLRDNFFHADMHPGNIFVTADRPNNPQYIAIDCAVIGSLSESDKYYIARNLLAIMDRDYALVAQLHIDYGWIPDYVDSHQLEGAIRAVCEPIFKKPLKEIAFAQVMLSLFQIARRFDMAVQPSLVLLQKTLFNIEGLGRELYPDLDIWATAKPYLQDWLKKRYAPKTLLKRSYMHMPTLLEQLPEIPAKLMQNLEHSQHMEQLIRQQQLELQLQQKLRIKQHRRQRRLTSALLLIAISILLAKPQWLGLTDLPWYSWVLIAVALINFFR